MAVRVPSLLALVASLASRGKQSQKGQDGGGGGGDKQRMVSIALNHALPKLTPAIWTQSDYRICADGGANRIYDTLPELMAADGGGSGGGDVASRAPSGVRISAAVAESIREQYVPDVIIGDLDSIRPEVRRFYESRGVPVIDLSHDQDSTDLMKCLEHLRQRSDALPGSQQEAKHEGATPAHKDTIVALGAIGGRLDHEFANINALYLYPDFKCYLLGDVSLGLLLPEGESLVEMSSDCEGPKCGLIPFAGPTIASSKGLRWDVSDTLLKFGGLISSCNEAVDNPVYVKTDKPLFWTHTVDKAAN